MTRNVMLNNDRTFINHVLLQGSMFFYPGDMNTSTKPNLKPLSACINQAYVTQKPLKSTVK